MGSLGLGRRFGIVWSASAVSNLADGVFMVALPLYAVTLTTSPALIGGLATAASLPWLLVSLPAGALSDRLDRRRSMVAVNLVRVALIGGLASVAGFGTGSIVLLYVVALALGTAETVFDTSAQALLPAIVRPAGLTAANSRLYATEILAGTFVGPPLGGLLAGIAGIGFTVAFGASAGAYLVAALALLFVHGTFRPASRGTTIRADIAEGARFLWRHPTLRPLAVVTALLGFGSMAFTSVFVLYVVGPMGLTETQYGLLVAGGGVGGLVGSWAAARLESALGPARLLPLTTLGSLAPSVTSAVTADAVAVGAAIFLSGASVLVWNVVVITLRQRLTPDRLLGRVTAGYRLVGRGGRPLGALVGGIIGELLGLRAAFAASAVVILVGYGYLLRIRRAALGAQAGVPTVSAPPARSSAPGGDPPWTRDP